MPEEAKKQGQALSRRLGLYAFGERNEKGRKSTPEFG
jgi:hypothetical protein